MKAEFRAITENQRRCESAAVSSSVTPSAKYSCAGSPVMLLKGSTTSMGRPAAGKDGRSGGGGFEQGIARPVGGGGLDHDEGGLLVDARHVRGEQEAAPRHGAQQPLLVVAAAPA